MQQLSSRLASLSVVLFGIYLFIYPASIILVALDRVPVWGTWMGGALLILQGTLMGVWLSKNYGRAGVVAAILILFLAWFVEHIGATTGFPFGAYTYTDVLWPQILDVVPLAIPFAWLLIVGAAVGTAEHVLEHMGWRPEDELRVSGTKMLTAASLALLLDVTIEPFAVNINRYWVWNDSAESSYYGIPASNFVAWWVTSVILVFVLLNWRRVAVLAHRNRPSSIFWPWLPLTLYLTNLTMFVVVNLARGQGMASVIGLLMLVALLWPLWPRAVRLISNRLGAGVGEA